MWLALLAAGTSFAYVTGEGRSERSLLFAGSVLVLTAAVHSLLGERFILRRLFRRPDLPLLFGDPRFVTQTLRFLWHLFSILLVGLAAVLVAIVDGATTSDVVRIISLTAALSALVAGVLSRGRHLSWAAFAAVSIATWLGA
jgi:hypothetical protein